MPPNAVDEDFEKWLDTDESASVGDKGSGGESIGHESGRKIVTLLRTNKSDLTDEDRHRSLRGTCRTPPALLADELGPRPAEVTR
jgi:hypothetical protein